MENSQYLVTHNGKEGPAAADPKGTEGHTPPQDPATMPPSKLGGQQSSGLGTMIPFYRQEP